jgi:hypothetical protein
LAEVSLEDVAKVDFLNVLGLDIPRRKSAFGGDDA